MPDLVDDEHSQKSEHRRFKPMQLCAPCNPEDQHSGRRQKYNIGPDQYIEHILATDQGGIRTESSQYGKNLRAPFNGKVDGFDESITPNQCRQPHPDQNYGRRRQNQTGTDVTGFQGKQGHQYDRVIFEQYGEAEEASRNDEVPMVSRDHGDDDERSHKRVIEPVDESHNDDKDICRHGQHVETKEADN